MPSARERASPRAAGPMPLPEPRLPAPFSAPMWGRRIRRSSMAKIRFANRHWHLPQSRPIRIGIGILLVAFGLLGFLPVLGFWIIPLGLLVLSVHVPIVRRWRRQLAVWWHRDRKEEEPGETGNAAR